MIIAKDIDEYLGEPRENINCLEFWKTRDCSEQVRKYVREVMALTATSAPSERVFSIAGDFYSAKRNRLSKDTFRSLLLIKMNQELFETLRM